MGCYASETKCPVGRRGDTQNLGMPSCLRMEVREEGGGRVEEWIPTLGEKWEDLEIFLSLLPSLASDFSSSTWRHLLNPQLSGLKVSEGVRHGGSVSHNRCICVH